jgi:hypothetical protein
LEVVASTPGWSTTGRTPLSVEYPAADVGSDETPQVLDQDAWDIYFDADGLWLFFKENQPATSETVRLRVQVPYDWIEANDPTIDTPLEHFEAISYLAAAKGARRLQSRYAQKRSSTIRGDVADRSRQAEQFKDLARQYQAEYESLLGLGEDNRGPAMAVVDMDIEVPNTGGFLFHGRRGR